MNTCCVVFESMHELVIEYESYVTYELVVSYKVPAV